MQIPGSGTVNQELCGKMSEYQAMPLINAINLERNMRGKSTIPASDDMCATALFKGLVQKVSTSGHKKLFVECVTQVVH